MNVKIPQWSREQVDCLVMNYVIFKFQIVMYTNSMNNSDKFRSISANQSSNMYNTELQSKSRWIAFSIPSKSQKKTIVAEGPSFRSRISYSKRNMKYEILIQ